MSNLIPNSFQLPNAFVDHIMTQVSGNATKCYLLVVRKTVGWGKESDRISISQFKKYTGVNDPKTIHKVVKELEDFGLILSKKERGLITEFSLNFEPLDQYQKTPPVPKNTSTKKRVKSSTKKPHSTKDNIYKTQIKESKPKKIHRKIELKNLGLVSESTAKEFIDHRVNIKKALTQNAFNRAVKQAHTTADQLGDITPDQVIEKSIDAGWQGIGEPEWFANRKKTNNAKGETHHERSERQFKEHLQERQRHLENNGGEIPFLLGRQDGVKLV